MNKKRKNRANRRKGLGSRRRMVVRRMNKYEIEEMRLALREREVSRILKKIKDMNASLHAITSNIHRLRPPDVKKNWNDTNAGREIEETLDNLNKRVLPEAERDLEFIAKAFDYIRHTS